nr:polyprotein [Johnsongrass mosaic virus]
MAGEWNTVVGKRNRRKTEEQRIFDVQKRFYETHQVYDAKRAMLHNSRILKRNFELPNAVESPKPEPKPIKKVFKQVWVAKVKEILNEPKPVEVEPVQPRDEVVKIDIGKFARVLLDQCKAYKIPVEIVGRKRKVISRIQPYLKHGKTFLKLETNHEQGSIKRRDINIPDSVKKLVLKIADKYDKPTSTDLETFSNGSSGITFRSETGMLFVIRGRANGVLINALDQYEEDLKQICHYSFDAEARAFWKGFTENYMAQRREAHDHTNHEPVMSVEECGKRAAMLENAFHQGFKITCKHCFQTFDEHSDEEVCERIHNALHRIEEQNRIFISTDQALKTSLRVLKDVTDVTRVHHADCLEVVKILEPTLPTPANRIVEIAKSLMKVRVSDELQMVSIGQNLLEIAKWFSKRHKAGPSDDLSTYKNKVAARGVVGNALMCDNQLDKNGDFLWGQRAYHAKRFLSNFYDIVDPSDEYDKHIIRRTPRSQRHLAIGKLIVTMDLEKMRSRLVGLPCEPRNIAQHCVSRLNGNIIYPCSCVTQESGRPLWSELIMPTKEHISLGNLADPHLVDLPQSDPPQMYIVKDGYCYLNIFLAMLIYVKEDAAKDFTKFIRDRIQPMLKEWPTLKDVATACYLTTIFYPETLQAEIPKILVDHDTKTMHVVDTFGSLTTGYHILKASTVAQLIRFSYNDLVSEMKEYIVGGDLTHKTIVKLIECLIKGIFNKAYLQQIIVDEPFLLLLAIESPCVLINMYNNGNFETAMKYYSTRNMPLTNLFAAMESFAKRVSKADIFAEQIHIMEQAAYDIHARMAGTYVNDPLANYVKHHLIVMMNRADMNAQLKAEGHTIFDNRTYEIIEKKYANDIQASWQELSWSEKLRLVSQLYFTKKPRRQCIKPKESTDLGGIYNISPTLLVSGFHEKFHAKASSTFQKLQSTYNSVKHKFRGGILKTAYRCLPDTIKLMHVAIIMSCVSSILLSVCAAGTEYKKYKREALREQIEREEQMVEALHAQFILDNRFSGTEREFIARIEKNFPHLTPRALAMVKTEVEHERKGYAELKLEQVIAFATLLTMLYDAERSDAVYKILQKIKACTNICTQEVKHEGSQIDDVQELENLKRLTVDFNIEQEIPPSIAVHDTTFEKWWTTQITQSRTTTHYRNKGEFLEFSRSNAIVVCNRIAHGSESKHFLVRGNVGSGKSTAIPRYLSDKGKVLVLEPTRPLTENVCQQLQNEPWCLDPTMQMRGKSIFGSTPITIMTTGFALHLFANNVERLSEFKFIIFDECHVVDSNAMAFSCLLEEYKYNGKIISVSATPPGRESEFQTEKEVDLRVFEDVSFDTFVMEQGTGSKLDAVSVCDSILIYVASYNEVDQMSRLLNEKGYTVTKVDGRTMNGGNKTGGSLNKHIHVSLNETLQAQIKQYGKHFIVATNIIENGVTLNVDGVVDFGTKVVADLDVDNRSIIYQKIPISYGERVQRLGRVGRFKKGYAFRIGTTQKGIVDIPAMTATEAAFLCFAYGLPVITHNVSTTHLSHVTSAQARTMLQFELPIFMMSELVKYDGHMHPVIHEILKQFKLRDSSISLRDTALPQNASDLWLSVGAYKKLGYRIDLPDDCKIPYYVNGVSAKMYEQIWNAVKDFRQTCCMRRMTSSCAGKIAYTLQTDVNAIPRTLAIIDGLIKEEQIKHSHFQSISANSTSSYNFSLNGIMDMLRSRYMKDHSVDNIAKLEMVKNQIIEFSNASINYRDVDFIKHFGALQTVIHENKENVCKELGLKGIWNEKLMCRDGIIAAGVAIGGALIGWECFKYYFMTEVEHEGKSKRTKQKLKFRDARDKKVGREVYGDDETIEHYFGEAYTKKPKKGNKTHGMGFKTRRFTHIYGVDPTEYDMIRFVDPLTGTTLDESTQADMALVKEHFTNVRGSYVENDILERQHLYSNPGIHAYFIKNNASNALKVDLTLHNPLALCRTNAIAGFPEYEGELRQTGPSVVIPKDEVPAQNEPEVEHEGIAAIHGVANYNPISDNICLLKNDSDGKNIELYGIGYGPYVIAPGHLFESNNGSLHIRSTRGLYKIPNTQALKISAIEGRDIILIRLPKDHPPFTRSIKFSEPDKYDKVIMLRMNFQQNKSIVEFSESSIIAQQSASFWKHWISTKAGYCGLPLVNTRTKEVVGIHSLKATNNSVNYFTPVNADLIGKLALDIETIQWTKGWKHNMHLLAWDGLHLRNSKPSQAFNTAKEIEVVNERISNESADTWLSRQFNENLNVVGELPGNLVTKHVVKGKCQLFQLFMSVDEQAKKFFEPLCGHYGKSLLNRNAFIKDFTKYDKPIIVGTVKPNEFEMATKDVINMLHNLGMKNCNYVTIADEIYGSMNMKASVGALYNGKKREYFANFTDEQREKLMEESCKRLYCGKLGVWNGSLKAEIRPMEKILANKTRTFTAAPLETLLGGKVCVDDFNNQFYQNHLKGPWTVGISKFYKGWDSLMRRLPENWVYCDADGSQFDSSLTPYLINAVLQIRLACMEEWDIGEKMLSNLYTEIVYTPIATPDGKIVKKFKGNNSGQPSTVVDNTLMLILAFTYALRVNNIENFEQDDIIKMFGNGDDLLIAVRPDFEYLLDTFKGHFADLGLNFDFSNRTRNREELWFMSHRGMLKDGVYIPKLEPERVVAILEWDRSTEPEHRLSAICAAIIESWGYEELTYQIRRFYQWVLEQEPYKELALQGKAPYLSETALRKLYLDESCDQSELLQYYEEMYKNAIASEDVLEVEHQSGNEDAGRQKSAAPAENKPVSGEGKPAQTTATSDNKPSSDNTSNTQGTSQAKGDSESGGTKASTATKDKDVDVGSTGTFVIPKLKKVSPKMRLPMVSNKAILNLDHLIQYKPDQRDISNARATHTQFQFWYNRIKKEYDVDDEQMRILMNGLMVWCIENGTSPDINGYWTMVDGNNQSEFPLKPIVENAKPTLRQCMMHFSDAAEAYIEMRNLDEPYMPRYGLLRNLNDKSLARYAFDFYEINSRTPNRAREAHAQMKAAAIRGSTNHMFGLDGNVGESSENTERHTAADVSRNVHSYRGAKI